MVAVNLESDHIFRHAGLHAVAHFVADFSGIDYFETALNSREV